MIILVWICINSWNTVYPLVCPIPSQLCCLQRCNFLGHTKWMVSRRRCACLAPILASPLVSIFVNLRLFCTTFHVAGRNDDERVPQAHFRIRLRLANWYLFEVIVYQKCNFCFRVFFRKFAVSHQLLGLLHCWSRFVSSMFCFFCWKCCLVIFMFFFCWKCCLCRPRNASIDVKWC